MIADARVEVAALGKERAELEKKLAKVIRKQEKYLKFLQIDEDSEEEEEKVTSVTTVTAVTTEVVGEVAAEATAEVVTEVTAEVVTEATEEESEKTIAWNSRVIRISRENEIQNSRPIVSKKDKKDKKKDKNVYTPYKECNKGNDCTYGRNCTFLHTTEYLAGFGKIYRCVHGDECRSASCTKMHPNKKEKFKTVECHFGLKCRNIDTGCTYIHP